MSRRPGQSPAVLLQAHHVGPVRAVLEANPGLSLRKLCPLVQEACGLPSMNEATLQRFISVRGFVRVLPAWSQLKAERVYGELGPEHVDLIRAWCAPRRTSGLVWLQNELERRLGFTASRQTLKAFLLRHGLLVDGVVSVKARPVEAVTEQESSAGGVVRWTKLGSSAQGEINA